MNRHRPPNLRRYFDYTFKAYFGHVGRPGKRGGSAPRKGGGALDANPVRPVSSGIYPLYRHPIATTVLASIDKVHRDGNISGNSLGVYGNINGGTANGVYMPSRKLLGVAKNGPWPHNSATHEVGHAVDHQGFGGGKGYGSDTPEFKKFHSAVEKSPTMKKWGEWERTGFVTTGSYAYRVNPAMFTYMRSNKEVWARAYSQYIATRSRNPKLLRDLRKRQQNPLGGQWGDKEFKPIAREIDSLMAGRGWK